MISDRRLDDEVPGLRGKARISLDLPTARVVEPGDAEARRLALDSVVLRMESKAECVLFPTRFGERERGEVDALDETALLRERRFGQTRPGPGAHDLSGGEEAVVLTARVLFGKSEAPSEFAPGAVPCRLVVRIESAPDRGLELVESPLAREEPRDGVDPVIPQVGEPAARDAGSCGRSVEETPSFLWYLRCQVEAVGQRERDGKTMMNLQERVVVGRDDTRDIGLVEAQILPPRMGPPRIEGRRVEPRPVPVVVEPQTEARAAQSERPDLRVLAVAALRPLLPLIRQV